MPKAPSFTRFTEFHQALPMRRRSVPAMLLTAASAAGAAGWPAEGVWVASSDHQAGGWTLTLAPTRGAAGQDVSGQVRQQHGALPTTVMDTTGRWHAPNLELTWRTPDGGVWTLRARLVAPERLQGTLAWPGGTTQPMTFVRP